MKISGMNPDEEIPAEDAHRGYYAPAGLEADRRDRRGAVRERRDRVRDPVLPRDRARGADAARGRRRSSAGTPAQRRSSDGDEIVAVNGVARPTSSTPAASRSPRTSAHVRRRREDGCARPTPATRRRSSATGSGSTRSITPFYDAERRALPLLGFGSTAPSSSTRPSPGEAAERSVDFMWEVTTEHGRRDRPDLRPRAARADLERRRLATRSPARRSSSTPSGR